MIRLRRILGKRTDIVTNLLHLHKICMRTILYSDEVRAFLEEADEGVLIKFDYVLSILQSQPVVNAKTAKKLTGTPLHELRIQVGNEYRILCFAIDHDNITQARNILLLNAFMKKATKDYDKQIKRALKILEQWTDRR